MGNKLLKVVLGIIVIYASAIIATYALMRQPPERFAKTISKLPGPVVFTVIPFKPLWASARAGHLKVGDVAPDFDLLTPDHKSRVRLSSFRGHEPVVLIFGSYT